jgi:hypothetical protein
LLVAARLRRAARRRADAGRAIRIRTAARPHRAGLTAGASAVQIRLGSIAEPVVARSGRASSVLTAKAVAIVVEFALVSAGAAPGRASLTAIDIRLAAILDAIRATRRCTSTRQAHARGAIGRRQAGLTGSTRGADATTIEVDLACVLLPILTLSSDQRVIQSAVLGKRAPGPPRSHRREQHDERTR